MYNLYNKILSEFNIQKSTELCSKNYSITFFNYQFFEKSAENMLNTLNNYTLIKRRSQEDDFHTFLETQMFSHLIEMKAYSKVNIADTRRFVSVSQDCISTIQMLIRDKIYLNCYFRSSDFDGCLPVDLVFLSSLPRKLILHLNKFKNNEGYQEVNIKFLKELSNKEICFNIMFGSLHRTKIFL